MSSMRAIRGGFLFDVEYGLSQDPRRRAGAWVVVWRGFIAACYSDEFLNASNAGKTHVHGDLDGIRAPWSYHFLARTYIAAFELSGCCRVAPPRSHFNFLFFRFVETVVGFYCKDLVGTFLKNTSIRELSGLNCDELVT